MCKNLVLEGHEIYLKQRSLWLDIQSLYTIEGMLHYCHDLYKTREKSVGGSISDRFKGKKISKKKH